MVGPTKFFTGVSISLFAIVMALRVDGGASAVLLCFAILAIIFAFTSWER
jgi:hypothetical protein